MASPYFFVMLFRDQPSKFSQGNSFFYLMGGALVDWTAGRKLRSGYAFVVDQTEGSLLETTKKD